MNAYWCYAWLLRLCLWPVLFLFAQRVKLLGLIPNGWQLDSRKSCFHRWCGFLVFRHSWFDRAHLQRSVLSKIHNWSPDKMPNTDWLNIKVARPLNMLDTILAPCELLYHIMTRYPRHSKNHLRNSAIY